jgi:hypothetical protein
MLEGVRDLAVPRFDSSCLASQWLVLHSQRSRDSALNERWRVSDVYGEANGLLIDVCSWLRNDALAPDVLANQADCRPRHAVSRRLRCHLVVEGAMSTYGPAEADRRPAVVLSSLRTVSVTLRDR